MVRCEDFPCCGHPIEEGCPDYSRTRKCKECGVKFHPDNVTFDYCYRCGAIPRYKPAKTIKVRKKNIDCEECKHNREKAIRCGNDPSLWEIREATIMFLYDQRPLCQECYEECEGENRAGWEQDMAEGRYDDQ